MKDLFTVCILHYNQMDYIFTAIDSVLAQDYENIELIIADDGSKEFDKKKVDKYIASNKKENIKSYSILVNPVNVGTVKNLNNVIEHTRGNYLTFFAADDRLSSNFVLTNYYNAFKKYKKEVITAQAFLYDNLLVNNCGSFVDPKMTNIYNSKSCSELLYDMIHSCLYASGATAYDMNVFKRLGMFDEDYFLVEDWSYYIKLLKNDVQIYFVNFPALDHRDGGVSHSNKISPTVVKYYNDILKIYEKDVLNDMPNVSPIKKLDIYKKIADDINYIASLIKGVDKDYYSNLIEKSKHKFIGSDYLIRKYTIQRKMKNFYKWHVVNKVKDFHKNQPLLMVCIITWLFVNSFILKDYYGSNDLYSMCLMAGSFLGISIILKISTILWDLFEYCLPFTFMILYLIKIWSIGNIYVVFGLSILIYVVIYYIFYILRILINKSRGV